MVQTRPPEEFVSPRPPSAPPRAARLTALVLAVLLVLVLAAGAWALWRPVSDDDAARLSARATVTAVRAELHPDPRWLPDDALARQLDALGPAASPAQQRRLDERGGTGGPPRDLADAADRMGRLAMTARDPELAVTVAAVAASWWAAEQSERGGSPDSGSRGSLTSPEDTPAPNDTITAPEDAAAAAASGPGSGSTAADAGDATRSTPGGADDGDAANGSTGNTDGDAQGAPTCTTEVLAAVTALDRSGYTAEAASARLDAQDATAAETVASVRSSTERSLASPAATALLACDPPPARGWYRLPAGLEREPAQAVGGTQHEAGDALVAAVAASSSGDRAWLVTALRETARAGQALAPRAPVPALPGRS